MSQQENKMRGIVSAYAEYEGAKKVLCAQYDLNPYDWLQDVMQRLPSHSIQKIEELLPHKWKKEGV